MISLVIVAILLVVAVAGLLAVLRISDQDIDNPHEWFNQEQEQHK